jgi:effector-binding domain-containing protein
MFTIKQRDVPEQLVLTEQRSVRAAELSDFLFAAIGRLMGSAPGHGGPAGPLFVVYHGQVTEDTPVAVEVCVPIASAPGDGVAARVEPAHREAYTTIRKEQVVFPEIQGAYRAVDGWVSSEGLTVADAPREVYFTDFEAAAPQDEVCDVAFPVR